MLTVPFGTVGPVSASPDGNNTAALIGIGDADADADASGQTVVDYREGTGTFNAKVSVTDLAPGATYSFFVRTAMGGDVAICTGTVSNQGTFSCGLQNVTLPGFVSAVVRDSAGVEVASGAFDRRGDCRDPQQAGSQCGAPASTRPAVFSVIGTTGQE